MTEPLQTVISRRSITLGLDDLDAAIKGGTQTYGAGPFYVPSGMTFDKLAFVGEPIAWEHVAAYGACGTLGIELQTFVVQESTAELERGLGGDECRLNQIGYDTKDTPAASPRLEELGYPMFLYGRSREDWFHGATHRTWSTRSNCIRKSTQLPTSRAQLGVRPPVGTAAIRSAPNCRTVCRRRRCHIWWVLARGAHPRPEKRLTQRPRSLADAGHGPGAKRRPRRLTTGWVDSEGAAAAGVTTAAARR